jgi:hypothetical protein
MNRFRMHARLLTLGLVIVAAAHAAGPAAADTAEPGDRPQPAIDPFLALVPKEEPVLPPPPPPPADDGKKSPGPEDPPPVQFHVRALAGESPRYVGVVEFEGQSYIVQPGTRVPSAERPTFEVKSVTADRVEVYDIKARRLVLRPLAD